MSSESVQLKEHVAERPQQTGSKLLQFSYMQTNLTIR